MKYSYKLMSFLVILIFSCLETLAQSSNSSVDQNGQLSISETKLLNEQGQPVQLKGMSLFWSQWQPQYYNAKSVEILKEHWNVNLVRAAMGIEHDGYLQNPEIEKEKVFNVIDAAIANGIYVIVDWHDHSAEEHTAEAKKFFAEVAQKYGGYPNLIYEIYNEPLDVSWNEVLKPYHEEIIAEIRKFDSDNIIVCGTSNWSQDVEEAAKNPIMEKNIAYSLHFYAGTHHEALIQKAEEALNAGLPIFVTEFGTTEANGDGKVYKEETQKWMEFMDKHNLSWCNWSIADKDEASAALLPGTLPSGLKEDKNISESGLFIKSFLRTSSKKH